MIAPSRRLLLRIYAVSLAQLLAIAGTIALVGWLTFRLEPRAGFVDEAEYAVANLSLLLHDRAALAHELGRIHALMAAEVSLYEGRGALIASNVTPPLPPLDQGELRRLQRERRALMRGRPPLLALPLDPARPTVGFAMYRPGPRPPRAHAHPAVWALGIALIGAALAAVLLARSFVQPLGQLAAVARKLGEGDLKARVQSARRDEFGQLAQAFDDMADRLTMVLRSQQELLANVSHELRTPLARIRVALDLAAEGDAATAQDALREITADLGELERLVGDVLQTARLDLATGRAGAALPLLRTTNVNPSELIAQIAQRFHSAHPERHLILARARELPEIAGDPVLLRRALENLLDNARAYSDDDEPVRLVAGSEPGRLLLSVVDRGIGIAENDLPNIAKPFFRTDRSRARRTGGLGLGLSLARRIAEAHGGELQIESVLGRGTTARIVLPSAAEAAEATPAQA